MVSVRPFVQGSSGAKLRELNVSFNRGSALHFGLEKIANERITNKVFSICQAAETGKPKQKALRGVRLNILPYESCFFSFSFSFLCTEHRNLRESLSRKFSIDTTHSVTVQTQF